MPGEREKKKKHQTAATPALASGGRHAGKRKAANRGFEIWTVVNEGSVASSQHTRTRTHTPDGPLGD